MSGARRWRLYHGVSALFWLVMIPVSFVTGLVHSLAFITLISLWALVATESGAWQASRAEVATVDRADEGEHVDAAEQPGTA